MCFFASANSALGEVSNLKNEAAALKKDIIELSRELSVLEESVLYPPEVKLGVFLSLGDKTRFKFDSIELALDGKLIASHFYQEKEVQSLINGGVQQLYMGAISPGKYKLTASFNGQGRTGGYFKRKKSLRFEKDQNARYIQLVVSEAPTTSEPIFKVKQW